MTRRNAREQALLILFEMSFGSSDTVEEAIQKAQEVREVEFDDFACRLTQTAWEKLPQLDERIEKHSDNWKLNRLPRVVTAILRLALSEILYFEDIPVSVAINEAVEIAKIYGGEEDWSFVNGVLGAVAKSERGEQSPADEN